MIGPVAGALIALGGGVVGALIVTVKDVARRQERAALTAWERTQTQERAAWLRQERLAVYVAFLRAGDAYARAVADAHVLRNQEDPDAEKVIPAIESTVEAYRAFADKLGAIEVVGGLDVSRAAQRYVACALDHNQPDGLTVSKNVQACCPVRARSSSLLRVRSS